MKKIIICAAVAALALSSCSKIDVVDSANNVPNNPNLIGFTSNTTRATANDVTNVEFGFQIFGHDNTSNEWYNDGEATLINGTFDYFKPTAPSTSVSDNNGWQWRNSTAASDSKDQANSVEAPTWPTALGDYPMTFYAAYPIPEDADGGNNEALSATAPVAPGSPTITGDKIIPINRFSQQDHLSAKASASVKPANGKIALTFNHILSKENVSVTAGENLYVEVQGIHFHNINSTNTYNYVNQTWPSDATAKAEYEYRRTVFGGSTTAGGTTANYLATPFFVEANSATEASGAKDAIHNNGDGTISNGNLMLLPQTFSQVTINTKGADANDENIMAGAYIEVFYRVETIGDVDVVGRKDIQNPTGSDIYYYSSNLTERYTWSQANGVLITTANTYNNYVDNVNDYIANGTIGNDALYIRAIFPIYSKDQEDNVAGIATWAQGQSYRYNLMIGGTKGNGGYYADNQYYDEAGNPTGLYHSGEAGDPVFDNRIHFTVIVSEWATDDPYEL